jgi:hypothetical protein
VRRIMKRIRSKPHSSNDQLAEAAAKFNAQARKLRDELLRKLRRCGSLTGERSLSDSASPQTRFFVRQGGKGWMVYDRERKGPAVIGTSLAANLTMEQAEQVKRMLVNPSQDLNNFDQSI